MSESTKRQRNWWRIARWTIGVIVVAAVAVGVAIFIWLADALSSEQEPPMKPDEIAALEDELRPKGSAEDALTHYETALQQMAADVTSLSPGLTWRWNHETGAVPCQGPLMDTRGVQVTPRHIVFNGPIPDELWPQALQRVRDRADALGATEVFVYVDKPGDHDLAITGDNGAEIRFGTMVAATLSARSDCYLKGADL
jgi:hypothetical protein